MSDRDSRAPRTGPGVAAALALALAALFGSAAAAAAQEWRSTTIMRQAADTDELEVEVGYGVGRFVIEPTDDMLYRANIRYDAERFDPIVEYEEGRLHVGVEGNDGGMSSDTEEGNRLELVLGRGVPMTLDLEFGAVEADLDLGGLSVRGLEVSTGASQTEMSFSRPNPEPLEHARFDVGAAEFHVRGLGNANVREVSLHGGAADIRLGFQGEWSHDVDLDVEVGLGSVTVVVPGDVGVRIEKDTFLASVGGPRMHERNGTFYSENWDEARYRLRVEVDAAFGDFNVEWTD